MNTTPIPVYVDDAADITTRPLTFRLKSHEAVLDLATYESLQGFAGLRKALAMTPQEVLEEIKDASVRGRGGAGFPAATKWTFMIAPDGKPRYLICNADEMEPGTFKDRLLLEKLPFQLIEGMLIAAYAIRATHGYIFIRGEYIEAARHLEAALDECARHDLIGENILDSDFSFHLHIHTGAGRYLCGEETALLNCLEGRRANPRYKPPFPQIAGAWGRPTVVNNVETLNNLPAILVNGSQWYKDLGKVYGKSETFGTKLFGASGRVKFPGLWEEPFGLTARQLIEERAGGMEDGLALKAWLPGGASSDFLTADHLDTVMDYDQIDKVGSRFGTGLLMVVDETQDMVALLRNLEEFFARESCGFCTPCRDGLPWGLKILKAMEAGAGRDGDIEALAALGENLWIGKTFCAHAPGAVEPLRSALRYFRAEFEAKIAAPAAVEEGEAC